jgi:hypothetical protein
VGVAARAGGRLAGAVAGVVADAGGGVPPRDALLASLVDAVDAARAVEAAGQPADRGGCGWREPVPLAVEAVGEVEDDDGGGGGEGDGMWAPLAEEVEW